MQNIIKLNVLIDNLGANQLSFFLIKSLNKLVENFSKYKISPIVYYERLHKHTVTPLFPTMEIADFFDKDGIAIATSQSTWYNLIRANTKKTAYYVWSIEHVYIKRHWKEYCRIFSEQPIIARCYEHKNILQSCFKINTIAIIENFSTNELAGVCYDINKS